MFHRVCRHCNSFGSLSNWKRMSSSMHRKKKKKKKEEKHTTDTNNNNNNLPAHHRPQVGWLRLSQQILLSFSFIAARVCVCVCLAHKVGKNDQLFEGFSAAWARWWWWWPWKRKKKLLLDPRSRIYRQRISSGILFCIVSFLREKHHSAPLFEFFRFLNRRKFASCLLNNKNETHHQLSKKKKKVLMDTARVRV